MKLTNARIIITGTIIEVYYYRERDMSYDYRSTKPTGSGIGIGKTEEMKLRSRDMSTKRAKSNLKRLINTNAYIPNNTHLPIFGTFTFKENIQDLGVANLIFSKFIKRLNYCVSDGSKKTSLKYIAVPEFQERGAVHYHPIFFNLKFIYIETLSKIWDQGFVFLQKIDSVKNVGAYISKYLCKDLGDKRFDNHKRYFSSRNLNRPIVVRNREKCLEISKVLSQENRVYIKDIKNDYHGKITYAQFDFKNDGEKLKLIKKLAGLYDYD